MKFTIEQIAISPKDPIAAKRLLADMGATKWHEDTVKADGVVFAEEGSNEAQLSFNYDLCPDKEFEVLHYTSGRNWIEGQNAVSHLGMHCTAAELKDWVSFFAVRGIKVAQEVFTQNHTNPAIAGKRRYHYVIFDTRAILGVDLKFIVRLDDKKEERGSN